MINIGYERKEVNYATSFSLCSTSIGGMGATDFKMNGLLILSCYMCKETS